MTKVQMQVEDQMYQLSFYQPAPAPPPREATTIRELPAGERPVNRLHFYGPGALSVSELLAIIIGAPDFGTVQQLLVQDGLSGLARRPIIELLALPGIGETKAAQLKAALELGRRLVVASPQDRVRVKSPADAANLLMLEMGILEQEELRVVILDTKNTVIKIHTVYKGSLNTAVVRVGELFKEAIRLNAAAVIMCHNHPSGDPTPSAEDVYITRQVVEAGKLLSIDVLDHMVICQSRWVSLKERGLGF